MASTISKRPRRVGEKIPELLRREEQDSEMNCPKSDNDFEGYIEFKKHIDDKLNILNFNKEFDSQALSETNNDTNIIKDLPEKINEL